jgi:hypothetical protein
MSVPTGSASTAREAMAEPWNGPMGRSQALAALVGASLTATRPETSNRAAPCPIAAVRRSKGPPLAPEGEQRGQLVRRALPRARLRGLLITLRTAQRPGRCTLCPRSGQAPSRIHQAMAHWLATGHGLSRTDRCMRAGDDFVCARRRFGVCAEASGAGRTAAPGSVAATSITPAP